MASFYGADGTLRAAERRSIADPVTAIDGFYSQSFEEYRYDALGPRLWVRSRQRCENAGGYSLCNLSRVRRTVWDGDRELYEIQMPGEDGSKHLETDVGLQTVFRTWTPSTGTGWRLNTKCSHLNNAALDCGP